MALAPDARAGVTVRDAVSLYDRFSLVRHLTEAVAHAHAQRLFHPALSPRGVLVVADPRQPAVLDHQLADGLSRRGLPKPR